MRFHKPALTSPVCKSYSRCVNRLREKCNLFFQFVSSRYEKRSTIYTSNKSFSEWGEILGDSVMASAVLDRILHHCTVINIKGESYRLKDRRKNSLPTERRGEKSE